MIGEMELQFQFLLSFFFFMLLIGVVASATLRAAQPKKNLLPPGPWQLPVVGSMHHLLIGGGGGASSSSSSSLLPHRRFRELSRTYGPLMHLKLGQVPVVVASSAEAARAIMKTHDLDFATRPLFHSFDVVSYGGRTLTTAPYGDYWRQLRKLCTAELLSASRVLSFRSAREEEVRSLVRSISSSTAAPVDLGREMSSAVNNIAAIGGRCEDQAAFLRAMDETVELVTGFDFADLFPSLSRLLGPLVGSKRKLERVHRETDEILEGVLQEHRAKRKEALIGTTHQQQYHDDDQLQAKEDFVDVLLRLQADGDLHFELTTDCIKAVTLDMFMAGSETSSTVLLWVMSELMKNPRAMRRAQAEVREALGGGGGRTDVTEADITGRLSYLQLVIKETLRLHPPVPLLIPRECRRTCEVLGYTVPEKTRVVVNAWAIGRDPECWEDAEEFRPERFEGSAVDFKGASFELLPFGAGRRMCPGMLFGMANVELVLARLLYHFDWKLPAGVEPEDFDMSESFGITARRSSGLRLHATPYIYST